MNTFIILCALKATEYLHNMVRLKLYSNLEFVITSNVYSHNFGSIFIHKRSSKYSKGLTEEGKQAS